MDATVDDFFNEINEIAPPKPTKPKQSVWQECHDELTGYLYYWNTKTDEVTWTTPAEYKSVSDQKKEKLSPKKKSLYVPPRGAPLFPSTSAKLLSDDSFKIYSIGNTSKPKAPERPWPVKKKPQKRPYKHDSDSEDEKIVMISSYGEESDSEIEEPIIKKTADSKKTNDGNLSDDDDDMDILTKIQKRAKELKELGGDLPPEVTDIVKPTKTEVEKSAGSTTAKDKKSVAGLSLVAGYSDSEEEQDSELKALFPVVPETPKVSHSTLFPITKPIDVKDFLQPTTVDNKPASPSNNFDSKAFQRKRRIGVALVNTGKKKDDPIPTDTPESERKGFGFTANDTGSSAKANAYTGFKKGGVMFVKSDVLNPTLPKEDVSVANDEKKAEEKDRVKREKVEDMYGTLKEKLGFLSEGRPPVLPVQAMIIQAEILLMAMRDGGLKLSYLQKWLNETYSELINLEKEAAPEGWLLQWDRSNKRYYYQNQTTGESQWEYPQPDISRCDEAMDISTTPPPIEPEIQMSPPLPPSIRSPTPPPPPIISMEAKSSPVMKIPDVPLPPEPAPAKFVNNGEPLPPGVDLPEIMSYNKPKEPEAKPEDPLYSALDSFYSDIAAIENTNSSSPPPPPPPVEENKLLAEAPTEAIKKKKKPKVKLAPGLAMKKKGVSQLVEKWKTVQQHYND